MRRLLLAFALLLVPTQALALVGAVASHRSGHQVSPTWSFPTACIVVRSSAGAYTAYVPAANTDIARGDSFLTYFAAKAANDQLFFKAATFDISNLTDGGLDFDTSGIGFYGMGKGTSGTIIDKKANALEGITLGGTGHVLRNMRLLGDVGVAGEPLLVKSLAVQNSSATVDNVYTDGVWLNAADDTLSISDSEMHNTAVAGGAVTITRCVLDQSHNTSNNGMLVGTSATSVTVSDSTITSTHVGISITANAVTLAVSNTAITGGGTSNSHVISQAAGTSTCSHTFTSCQITLSAGTGSCVNMATAVGAKTWNFYSCTFTAPAAGFGVRAGGSQANGKVWNGSITGPDGTTGKSLIQTAGTLSYNSAVQNGYAATTGSPSLSTSGTVGTSN